MDDKRRHDITISLGDSNVLCDRAEGGTRGRDSRYLDRDRNEATYDLTSLNGNFYDIAYQSISPRAAGRGIPPS